MLSSHICSNNIVLFTFPHFNTLCTPNFMTLACILTFYLQQIKQMKLHTQYTFLSLSQVQFKITCCSYTQRNRLNPIIHTLERGMYLFHNRTRYLYYIFCRLNELNVSCIDSQKSINWQFTNLDFITQSLQHCENSHIYSFSSNWF